MRNVAGRVLAGVVAVGVAAWAWFRLSDGAPVNTYIVFVLASAPFALYALIGPFPGSGLLAHLPFAHLFQPAPLPATDRLLARQMALNGEAFGVVLFNDASHTFDYVAEALTEVCGAGVQGAYELAWQVHTTGRAVVFVGTREECDRRRQLIDARGRDRRMPKSDGPLKTDVERLPTDFPL